MSVEEFQEDDLNVGAEEHPHQAVVSDSDAETLSGSGSAGAAPSAGSAGATHPAGAAGQDVKKVPDAEHKADGGAAAEAPSDGDMQSAGEVAGAYNSREVNGEVFEELHLNHSTIAEIHGVWNSFINSAENREAAGEALYAATFDSSPILQPLFKLPRAIMAMRFMTALTNIINSLDNPKALKVLTETLGFQHFEIEVTAPRVVIFRDAIIDLLASEMSTVFTPKARDGWHTLLNYVGGAFIFIREKYSDRLNVIASSWAQATMRKPGELEVDAENSTEEVADGAGAGGDGDKAIDGAAKSATVETKVKKERAKKNKRSFFSSKLSGKSGSGSAEQDSIGDTTFQNTAVPKNFNDMFLFNAAVMGFGGRLWMREVLDSFDNIVTNVSSSSRVQEECDILSLRLAKHKIQITLPEFKSVMLASLRSLVMDWGSLHETSWAWLWENVERMLQWQLGKPLAQEEALQKFFSALDATSVAFIRTEVYTKFFSLAPAGQDHFKQSTTRLHFIADKLVALTLDMYKDARRMVQEISALGLRHVGYGVPTELCGPYVTACVQVIRLLTEDDKAVESFRWSLGLISRIMIRAVNEGATIVMKAINANSGKQLRKALGCAPRGHRAMWMLNIQVGTQCISPLLWALETCALDAAKGIIVDLLTIRADRTRYYYGMDTLFERHPDIIKRLSQDAPAIIPVLLDGLVWRSRATENGLRRVNYYIKHLVVDADGEFSKATEWLTEAQDPKLVCHGVVALVTDTIWSRIAFHSFLYGKAWFLFTLMVFITSQSILTRVNLDEETGTLPLWCRLLMFACRCFIYFVSMGQWLVFHVKAIVQDIRAKNFVYVLKVPFPEYLSCWQDVVSLFLTICLFTMFCLEPTLRCLAIADDDSRFSPTCSESSSDLTFAYSIFSFGAMLMYFLRLSDLSVFSTRVSAFVLVCGRVLSEVILFLFGLLFFVVAFACAIVALQQDHPHFNSIDTACLHLLTITFSMSSGEHFDSLSEYPALLFAMYLYVVVTIIFLLNLLIAQLLCAYQATFKDMLGYARLHRGKIVAETMVTVSKSRWDRFVESLRLDERCEFGEGDIGLAGGIQIWEPASANITTDDMIRRFGGTTSPSALWPEDDDSVNVDVDRFSHIEKLIEKAMKRMSSHGGSKKGGGSSSSGGAGTSTVLSSSQDGSGRENSGSE